MTDPGGSGQDAGQQGAAAHGHLRVELVGPHLRVTGHLALGRYPRLADLVNHNRGFLIVRDACLLDGSGTPTGLTLPELVVNRDEVTFIGHGAEAVAARPHPAGATSRFVIFAPGHTISGAIHRYRDISLVNFVEAHDPRFVEVTEAAARAQAEPGMVMQYACMLVNRTQINAIAELPEGAPDPALDLADGGGGHGQPGPAARARA